MTQLSLFELNILDWFQSLRNPLFDALAKGLDLSAGHGEIFILVTLLLLMRKPTRKVGLVCATALIFDLLLVNVTVKPLFERIRPFDLNPAVDLIIAAPHDFSFPSGHTAVSFAFAAGVSPMGRKAHTLALAFASVMGISRLYLYVHYPTDVLAGAFLGTVCGLAALLVWKKAFKHDIII